MVENDMPRLSGRVLRPLRDGSFLSGSTRIRFVIDKDAKPASLKANDGEGLQWRVVESPWTITADELKSLAGVWNSEEAGSSFKLIVENGQAYFVQRPTRAICCVRNSKIISV